MSDRCDVMSPGFVRGYWEACGLDVRHVGFHKSNHAAWPNNDDPTDWASIGSRLLNGEPPTALSLREIEYAIAAYQAHEAVPVSPSEERE